MSYAQERDQVIHIGREIYQQKLVAGTWGNVSLRLQPGGDVLITPSGMPYTSLQPDDLVVLDQEGKVREGFRRPSSESPLHMEIYRHRPDIGAVVHVHSPWAAAYAATHLPIPMLLEESAQVIGHDIPVAPYQHPGTRELAQAVVATIGREKRAVLLANHGLVGVGTDLPEALLVCVIAEKTAMIALLAQSLGRVHPIDEENVSYLHRAFKSYGQPDQQKNG